MRMVRTRGLVLAVAVAMWGAGCGERPSTAPRLEAGTSGGGSGVTVTSTNPDSAPQGTTLAVHVFGSGYDRGSNAQWARNGVVSPNVTTNSTQFVSSSELVANITIAGIADTGFYDVLVTTSKGKKGIGSELFTIKKGTPPPPPADPAIALASGGLMVMNADGSNQTVIIQVDKFTEAAEVSWSPDARSIVFDAQIGGVTGIWITDVSVVNGKAVGSNLRLLDPGGGYGWSAWSPVGDLIVLTHGSGDTNGLYVVPPTGGTPTLVYMSAPGFIPTMPDWSPDASKLVFVESSTGSSVFRSLLVFDRVRRQVDTVLSPSDFFVRFPTWSRGGDRIAYSGYSGTNPESVYTVAFTGSVTPSAVPIKIIDGRDPAWSPNDSKIAFLGGSHRTAGLIAITLATGVTQMIASVGGRNPDWRRF